ncbi:Fatty acid-binding protein [Aphelenchoides avenae]|nr:Fatty acid-binding protein [Aphelenchus avenae]
MAKYSLVALTLLATTAFLESVEGACKEIPAKFLGRFVTGHRDENLDENLKARGYGWLQRRLVLNTKLYHVVNKAKGTPCAYDFAYESFVKDVHWKGFSLDVPFDGTYLDDKEYTVTLTYDPVSDTLVKHLSAPGQPLQVYTFQITGDGFLLMRFSNGAIEARRWFKRV